MDMKDIKVTDTVFTFDKVVEFINFVVSKSFGNDGMYHKYLRDFAEACAVITMYTDYDSREFDMNEVMEYVQSNEWATVKQQLGNRYIIFDRYIDFEINNINTPLRFADNTLKAVTNAINKINEVLNTINIENLKNYDFSKLIEAADSVNESKK